MEMENVIIGKKLKTLRTDAGLTLQEAAEAIGGSIAHLSLVENGRSGISLSKLQRLLTRYGKTMADLVEDSDLSDSRVVTLSTAKHLGFFGEGVEALLLAKDVQNKAMEPSYFRVEPGATVGPMQHVAGEECLFVLDGRMKITLEDPKSGETSEYNLESGATIYYDSTLIHTVTNTGNKPLTFYGCCTPAAF
ncbi:helix-turn-helix domain-containing protein [Papillibacter cinnamivorans]|uniref:Helix-turn-helix domain-containing protein n=1 Tax=Papillibacter cinnamivorans DSM 12816 TaxID=1122930 RepID=A0A1W1YJJ3_9FIRM|nr:cupin domain-containing protein [Papillibacter cinnamivorans]SMC36349.1 Helix-turn-helix domain-containing protein [Papillibacter cinnamivorans DSM 12816]